MLVAAGLAHAAPHDWQLDPVHTRVLVEVSHDGFSQALGTVSGSTGWIRFDPDDPAATRVIACVPLDRLDFGDADWNRAVSRLLGTAAHPSAWFDGTATPTPTPTPTPNPTPTPTPNPTVNSDPAAPRAPDAAPSVSVSGPLTLNGTTRPMTLAVTVNRIGRLPLPPFRRRLGASARAELARADYGVEAWPSLIGATVRLRIEAEAEPARQPFPTTVPPAASSPCP
jgi:polyisoprenoid-binding protein YceI